MFFHPTVQESCSEEGTIRLTKSSVSTAGRLEVCSGGTWGTVCGNTATTAAVAKVACRELDHAAEGS